MLYLHVREGRYLTNPTVMSFKAMTHNLFRLPVLDPQHVLSYPQIEQTCYSAIVEHTEKLGPDSEYIDDVSTAWPKSENPL